MTMKKIIAAVLCLVLGLSCFSLCGTAAEAARALSYPTVMVAGYSSSALFLNTADGQEKIWGLDFPNMLVAGLSYIADIGIALGDAVFEHSEKLVELSHIFERDYLENLKMNPDGSSMYDVVSYPRDAAKATYSYIYEKAGSEYATEPEITETIASAYGENGYGSVYCFHTDFRKGSVSCATDLDEFIENILAYTGAEKVNVYAVSHGGQTTATYLSLFGYKNHVNNVVMTVPAIGGAALAADILGRDLKLDEEELMRFVENGMMFETDIQWLMKAQKLGFLDTLCNALIDGMLLDVLGYWGSIWDFVPAGLYEQLKSELLDPDACRELIAQSDEWHYDILPNYAQAFADCMKNGANIYIVAGCDNASVTGMKENSDAIIPLNASTGAKCAPWSERFADGYACSYTNCGDSSHNHLSPAMNIDASTGYLPEQTWYVSGLFHGMTWKDDYTIDLCMKLLFSDERLDVRSDSAFPQFHYSTNTCYSAFAAFDASTEGFVSSEDSVLRVTNLSEKYVMRLMDVSCYGADVSFRLPAVRFILPGETAELKLRGELPEKSLTTLDVTMTYKLIGGLTPYGTRTQTFTVMNGDIAEGDGLYAAPTYPTPFDTDFSEQAKGLLSCFGLTDLIRMIYNYLQALTGRFFATAVC